MCVEMSSRTHKSGSALSYITEEQDSNMLRVFMERDELIVPIKITRLSIEDVVVSDYTTSRRLYDRLICVFACVSQLYSPYTRVAAAVT
jgi:hypothetical protein